MKTRIYIDGYNLYYGCLKGTPYKWLDIVKLFQEHVLPSSSPSTSVLHHCGVKFFTADIVEKAATSRDSRKDQQTYHRALSLFHDAATLQIIKGYYSVTKARAFQIEGSAPAKNPNECNLVDVWKLEEKQTDVNIAVESLHDAYTDSELEQIVYVTNDTDLVPALEKIKSIGRIKIGLVIPTADKVRRPNAELSKLADWTRQSITLEELSASQLPRTITGGRKPVAKPDSWFGQQDDLKEILALLQSVEGSRSKCWKWLESPKPRVDGLPILLDLPVNLLDDGTSSKHVLEHARAYVSYKKNNGS